MSSASSPSTSSSSEASKSSVELADLIVCWFLRHWLGLILTGMFVIVTLPFLAPLAMHLGWTRVGRAIYTVYIPFCHQLPQRSWFLFGPNLTYRLDEITEVVGAVDISQLRFFYGTSEMGWKVAWSDRMISFYFMTPIFGMVYAALRSLGLRIPPIPVKLLLLTLAPLAIDGVTHMISDILFGISAGGFRDTNAWLAVITANRFPGFYAGDHFGTFNWWMRLLTGLVAAWGLAFFMFPHIDKLMKHEERITCGGTDESSPPHFIDEDIIPIQNN